MRLSRRSVVMAVNAGAAAVVILAFQNFSSAPRPVTPAKLLSAAERRAADVYLADLLSERSTTVKNAAGRDLPRSVDDLPNLPNSSDKDYRGGHLTRFAADRAYGQGSKSGDKAITLLAPDDAGDVTRLTLRPYQIDAGGVYWLRFKVGLQDNAPTGTLAHLTIKVSGKTSKLKDDGRYQDEFEEFTVFDTEVAKRTKEHWIPLGLRTRAAGFTIQFEARRHGGNNWYQSVVIDDPVLYRSQNVVQSIVRSNVIWEKEPVREKIYDIVTSEPFAAGWFRDGLMRTNETHLQRMIAGLKTLNARNKPVLLVMGPNATDYDRGSDAKVHAGEAFKAKCGWDTGQFKFSDINLEKLAANLRKALKSMKDAGVVVDAFEIGNEVNWVCFNGDIPLAGPISASSREKIIRAYAEFLRTAARVIRSPEFYPRALIISAGMVTQAGELNGTARDVDGYLARPGAFLGRLEQLKAPGDQRSYLDTYVNRLGMHIYPEPSKPESSGRYLEVIQQQFTAFTGHKNFRWYWLTEWGLHQWGYQYNSVLRERAMVTFLESILTAKEQAKAENLFFYDLDASDRWGVYDVEKITAADGTVIDKVFRPLPETGFFKRYQAN